MKKLLISLIFTIVSLSMCAQFRYGPAVGVSLNNLVFKQDLVSVGRQVGFSAGVQGELMFPGIGFGVDIGLLYSQQGARVNLGEKEVWRWLGYGNERIYIHNLTIPVHLRFKYTRLNGFEEIIAPLVFGGPDFNIQVAHSKCDAIKFSGGDLGLTVGIGAEIMRRWQITGSYTWGMTYALKTHLLDGFSAQSRQWTVRLSYFF